MKFRHLQLIIISISAFLLTAGAVYGSGVFFYNPANPPHFEITDNLVVRGDLNIENPADFKLEVNAIQSSSNDDLTIESKQGVSLILNKAGSNSNAFLEVRGANNSNEGLLIDQKGRLTFRDTTGTVLGGWKNYINFPSGGALVWPTRTNNQPESADKLALFGHSTNTDGFYWRTDADGTPEYIASLHDDGNFMVTGSITTGTSSSGLVLSGNTVKTRGSGSLKLEISNNTPVEITNDTVTVGGNLKVTEVISSSYCLNGDNVNGDNDCVNSWDQIRLPASCNNNEVAKYVNNEWECGEDIDTTYSSMSGPFEVTGTLSQKNDHDYPIFIVAWEGKADDDSIQNRCVLQAQVEGDIIVARNQNNDNSYAKICSISFFVPAGLNYEIISRVPKDSKSSDNGIFNYIIVK